MGKLTLIHQVYRGGMWTWDRQFALQDYVLSDVTKYLKEQMILRYTLVMMTHLEADLLTMVFVSQDKDPCLQMVIGKISHVISQFPDDICISCSLL